jgi:hypothetical protein
MTWKRKILEIAFVAFGLIIVLWSLLAWPPVGSGNSQWAVMFIVVGAVMVLFGIARLLRGPGTRGDERTRKLGAYAATWSWFSTLTVASILFLMERWGTITVSADQVLEAMLLTLLGTIILFNAYYRKRGDAE